MDTPYDIHDRTFLYACRIGDFSRPVLPAGAAVRELARQLIRSGTSVGANVEGGDGRGIETRLQIKARHFENDGAGGTLLAARHRPDGARLQAGEVPLIDETRQLIQIITTMKLNSERNDQR